MRILVTRPQGASRRTSQRLKALGHDPVTLPVTEARHHPDEVRDALDKPYSALLVTSAEAIRVAQSPGTGLAGHLGATVFTVGEATARAAREAGFSDVEAAEGTGASMVRLFAGRWSRLASAVPLLYLAGWPRSPSLEAGLAELRIPHTVARAYTMRPLEVAPEAMTAALRRPPVDAVLFYSRETARRFFELAAVDDVPGHARLLCLSGNIMEAVPEALRPNVRISARPDEDSLLALL
ncbi:uroporphyrinogen III synthase [Pseudorhizobium endolithicum]|uniref:Uroporphyrinogen-III synthase n=1 Tax=Pseudorhizobium endolithicum TaxID=1191678 RepID=A0ABM8PQG9_9HYPH|nr:uroporphyrinogen-III synthase [Pseudorhizobium endolithicum]CAD7042753.1 uroporphyrinogen III synthase [Pseudorhizobium endolithicum]